MSKYCNIIERKTGLAVLRKRMHAAHPAIKMIDVSRSRRREYQPKTPMVI